MGLFASLATFIHGSFELLLIRAINMANASSAAQLAIFQQAPSQVDPSGLATFFITGLVTFIFSFIMMRSTAFPKTLASLGMLNALLLVVLFFASAFNINHLILISSGLTSVILGLIRFGFLPVA